MLGACLRSGIDQMGEITALKHHDNDDIHRDEKEIAGHRGERVNPGCAEEGDEGGSHDRGEDQRRRAQMDQAQHRSEHRGGQDEADMGFLESISVGVEIVGPGAESYAENGRDFVGPHQLADNLFVREDDMPPAPPDHKPRHTCPGQCQRYIGCQPDRRAAEIDNGKHPGIGHEYQVHQRNHTRECGELRP